MAEPVTHYLHLEQLDDYSATFDNGQDLGDPNRCDLTLPRSDWEDLGRPNKVAITPVSARVG